MAIASVAYRAVGWGSHHWDVADAAGSRWFVTADDLEEKRLWEDGPTAQCGRLRAALTAAGDLRDCGRTFVVAPVPARNGALLALVSGRFATAVYPFVGGQAFTWGEFSSAEHRLGVLALLAAVHTAPAAASRHALADDFTVPHRAALEAALGPARETAGRLRAVRAARRATAAAERSAGPAAARPVRRPRTAGQVPPEPDGPHPRRAARWQHHAHRRRLGPHRLGYRSGRPPRARPVAP